MIADDDEIPLTTAAVMIRWKWFYAGLAVLIVVILGRLAFTSGDWGGVLAVSLVLVVPVLLGLRRASRYEKILSEPAIAARMEKYRTLKKAGFEDACRRIEEDGSLVSSKKVIMASPFTWSRKQGFSHYRCEPFEVLISEKNGQVGSLHVLLRPTNS